MSRTDELREALRTLAATAKCVVSRNLSEGSIQPEELHCFRDRVESFAYGETGVIDYSAHGEEITKPSWLRATAQLQDRVKHLKEYNSALELLVNVFDRPAVTWALHRFVQIVIVRCLENSTFDHAEMDVLATRLLRDLRNEPRSYQAVIALQGMVLEPDIFELDSEITVRRPRIEDFEKETLAYGPHPPYELKPKPSAFLEIKFLGKDSTEIRWKVDHAVAVLTLFKVMSIWWMWYDASSESITDIAALGTCSSGMSGLPPHRCWLSEKEVPILRTFWQVVSKSIPADFVERTSAKPSHLTLAYERYREALFVGLFEREIASGVMGLEALFLRGGETQELSYRLALRVSRLMGLLGHDANKVREALHDAYRVRSSFVHGSELTHDQMKDLLHKYQDLKDLVRMVLDCLRITILLMILVGMNKKDLLGLLEASLTDGSREKELSSRISPAKEILSTAG
jgi:hypothetical protein